MVTEDYLNELAEDCVEGYDHIQVIMHDDNGHYTGSNEDCVTYQQAEQIFKDGFRAALRQVQSEYFAKNN